MEIVITLLVVTFGLLGAAYFGAQESAKKWKWRFDALANERKTAKPDSFELIELMERSRRLEALMRYKHVQAAAAALYRKQAKRK